MSNEYEEVQWFEKKGIWHGAHWINKPCLSIGKSSMVINQIAVRTLGFRPKDLLCVGLTRTKDGRALLLLKEPTTNADYMNAYELKAQKKTQSLEFGKSTLAKKTTEYVGDYEINLNPGQRIFEVDLSQPLQ